MSHLRALSISRYNVLWFRTRSTNCVAFYKCIYCASKATLSSAIRKDAGCWLAWWYLITLSTHFAWCSIWLTLSESRDHRSTQCALVISSSVQCVSKLFTRNESTIGIGDKRDEEYVFFLFQRRNAFWVWFEVGCGWSDSRDLSLKFSVATTYLKQTFYRI